MEPGLGIALGSLILSIAIAFNGYRSTRFSQLRDQFKDKIADLEEENDRCNKRVSALENKVEDLRADNAWLIKQMQGMGRPAPRRPMTDG